MIYLFPTLDSNPKRNQVWMQSRKAASLQPAQHWWRRGDTKNRLKPFHKTRDQEVSAKKNIAQASNCKQAGQRSTRLRERNLAISSHGSKLQDDSWEPYVSFLDMRSLAWFGKASLIKPISSWFAILLTYNSSKISSKRSQIKVSIMTI